MTAGRGLVAVTGAAGFLGRRLVPALRAAGWRVRSLVRHAAEAADPDRVIGDVNDGAVLARLVDGADLVIHAAGRIKARRRNDFFEVNATGAARIAQACGGRRLILVSSLAAREPGLSDYAASKAAGEAAARTAATGPVLVVRPPALYGPGDRETLALFRLAGASPLLVAPGPPGARLALAHVDDVAALLVTLARDGRDAYGLVTIGGARPDGYGWGAILETAAAAWGRRPVIVAAPGWAVTAAALVSEIRALGGGPAPMFTRGKAREILHPDWSVKPAELGRAAEGVFRPLADGFAGTLRWYREAGWLR